jgi:hypothetical protein
MHSEDRGPGIRTPQEQLLLSMLYFVGTDVSLDIGWDQDPCRGPAIDVFFKLSGGRCQTHRQRPPPPPGALPSTPSLASVVVAVGSACSAP